ncbi:exonuclease 3'-5' domain-containing protein 2 [Nilaparvata lugens]|uniref:exonuclease 3'-5' domain-containing protein 2 n=1 Tax=Nilaparvata lugens TaxID=108931 RepID=UPI00193DDC3F|nr:exonuclease 3'-5' domain-containing protein 2 [Nilaparvata lugens]
MLKFFNSFLNKLYPRKQTHVPARTLKLAFIVTSFGIICCVCRCYGLRKFMNSLLRRLKWRSNGPNIIHTANECHNAVLELRKKCKDIRVIGLDCEWVSEGKKTNKIALLQLASIDGYCSLIRLCALGNVPNSLKELLSDRSIIKTGVAVNSDASRLLRDYGVPCKGVLDLRHLAQAVGSVPAGLGKMSNLYLNKELDKDWRIRCSNWEDSCLSERQIQYAADDALVSVQLFEYFNNLMLKRHFPWYKRLLWSDTQMWAHSVNYWRIYINIPFNQKGSGEQMVVGSEFSKSSKSVNSTRKFSTKPVKDNPRQKPLYHNIYLEAPDGEVLCTCDDSKATWYLTKGLAEIISEEPLRLRLTFEPSGRNGAGDEYYALPKNNECVVCGSKQALRRKNIVPLEYRKYFPIKMKDHCSHDVLLLCFECHIRNSHYEQELKNSLAAECNAPLSNTKENRQRLELPDIMAVRSAARALLKGDRIPEPRKQELRSVVTNYLRRKDDQVPELNDQLLNELGQTCYWVKNEDYNPHGLKVVDCYKDRFSNPIEGLRVLEKMWRRNFVDNMQPEFLPQLWSINYEHNQRLF